MRCLLPAPSSGFPYPSFLPGRGVWLEKDASCIFVVSAGKSRVKPPKHVARPTQATLPRLRWPRLRRKLGTEDSARIRRGLRGLGGLGEDSARIRRGLRGLGEDSARIRRGLGEDSEDSARIRRGFGEDSARIRRGLRGLGGLGEDSARIRRGLRGLGEDSARTQRTACLCLCQLGGGCRRTRGALRVSWSPDCLLYRDILTVPRLGVAPVAVQRISTKNRTTEAAIPGEVFGRGRDSLELRHDVGQQRVGHCNHGLPRPARRARRAIQHRPLREAVGAGAARGAEGR